MLSDVNGDFAIVDDLLLLLAILFSGTAVTIIAIPDINYIHFDDIKPIESVEDFINQGETLIFVTGIMFKTLIELRPCCTYNSTSSSGIVSIFSGTDQSPDINKTIFFDEHTNGAKPSTRNKHQEGQTRKKRDNRGEKGDKRRPIKKGNTKKVLPK